MYDESKYGEPGPHKQGSAAFMALRNQLFNKASVAALVVLRLMDRYISGSNMGRTIEEARRNPHPGYRHLRKLGPVVRSYASRGWLVTQFDAVQAASRDPRFGNDMRKNRFLSTVLRAAADGRSVPVLDSPSMIVLDPPDHTCLRRLVSQGFTNRYVQTLAPRIEAIVKACLSELDGEGEVDIMASLARPLPAIVIAEMLGLPEADREQFRVWAQQMLGITAVGEPELIEEATVANEELVDYLRDIVALKRAQPDEGIISQLIAAEEEGDRLAEQELLSTCTLLLNAGHLTTTSLIGTGLWLLLKHPEQLQLLRKDRSLMDNAIEEMLRFEAPVQFTPRFALEDMTFYGQHIRKNQLVLLMVACANRDEAANPHSDRFDITREQINHVAFGHGIHLCLGLALAKVEAKIAFNAILDHFESLELIDTDPPWAQNALVRGPDRLRVAYCTS